MPRSRTGLGRAGILAALLLVLTIAGASLAALLGLVPDFPLIVFDTQGTLTYDAETDLLQITSAPVAVRFSPSEPPVLLGDGFVFINLQVDELGALTGGVLGDDLAVTGSVLVDGNTYFGNLLTGEVAEFGFEETGTTTDLFDFRFLVTGGALDFLYAGQDLAVVTTSEQSDFVGDFSVDFGGGAKGTIGATPPHCGDGILDPNEGCDPPGEQAQCPAGQECNDSCQCEHVPTDHFKCYRAKQLDPRFERLTVELEDQFATTTATVKKPLRFCNPVDKDGEGIYDDTAHLMCYKIKEPRFTKRDVIAEDQFGEQHLTLRRVEQLCVPAEKNGVPSALNVDHFKCYKVSPVRGTPRFQRRDVVLADQFETKDTTVMTPRLFCAPVDKNGEGILDPDSHLTCYKIKDVPGQERFQAREIEVLDQFSSKDVMVVRQRCRKATLLCVPSTKRLVLP